MISRQANSEVDNVVAFPQVQSRIQIVDPNLSEYMKAVNIAMREQAGVHYLFIRTSLHNDPNDALRSYMDRGVDPVDAVTDMMEAHGLKSVSVMPSAASAEAYNKVQAAISEFIASSNSWHRSADGRVFSEFDGGVAFIRPVPYTKKQSPNEPDNFGFGIEVREGASIDYYTSTVSDMGTVTERFAGWDLSRPRDQFADYIEGREEKNSFTF